MHRATLGLTAVLIFVGCSLLPSPARAQFVDNVDGIGLLDYRRTPKLEVGSWVKYRITARSERGHSDDYYVTILIAGEERFWGEDCFWVETWTGLTDEHARAIANLVSYDIFEDPEQYIYAKYYSRKTILGYDSSGAPEETVSRFPLAALQSRDTVQPTWTFDTLGTETIEGPKGEVVCSKFQSIREAKSVRAGTDSTRTTSARDRRVDYWSASIPITGIVREDIELHASIVYAKKGEPDSPGRSKADVSIGKVELIDYGTGAQSKLLPPARCKSLEQQDAEQARSQRSSRSR